MKQFCITCLLVLFGITVFGQLNLLQQSWEFNWYWMPNDATLQPNDISFVFPSGNKTANSLLTRYSDAVPSTLTTTIRIDVLSGEPVFEYDYGPDNPCTNPATIRPYFEVAGISDKRKGSPFTGGTSFPIDGQYLRWWSNPVAIVLAQGTYTISVPYTPSAWTSVYGVRGTDSQEATDGFNYVLNHLGKVGFTFGGGCFFGHGVWTSGGDARLTVLQYDVN